MISNLALQPIVVVVPHGQIDCPLQTINHLWLLAEVEIAKCNHSASLGFIVVKTVTMKIFQGPEQVVARAFIFALGSHNACARERSRKESTLLFFYRPGVDEPVQRRLARGDVSGMQPKLGTVFQQLCSNQTYSRIIVCPGRALVVFNCSFDLSTFTIKISIGFESLGPHSHEIKELAAFQRAVEVLLGRRKIAS